MKSIWLHEFFRFALALIVAALLGLWINQVVIFLFVATSVYLLIHLLNLYRLQTWLISGRARPPETGGIWGEIFNEFYRLQRRNRQRKQRLAQLLREFRASTAAMPEGTVILDRDWQVIWHNDAAENLLGLTASDVGQHISNLVRSPVFVDYLKSGNWKESLEMPAPANESRRLTLHVIPYGEGQHLLLVRDTTRLHRLEKMRREFVANASHELRSPLTVIAGYLETLAEDKSIDAQWQQPMDEMRHQSARMTSLVNDLLELSRLETEADNNAARDTIDVHDILVRIQKDALALGEGPKTVTLEIESQTQLLGVQREIYSAFSNLVFNAMRYTSREGSVQLRWYETPADCRFSVTDTGIGIKAAHIPHLTERFYRADSSRSRSKGGTGLGLAIVKHVLQRHGGQMQITSTPGKGSTFTCVFPLQRAVRSTS